MGSAINYGGHNIRHRRDAWSCAFPSSGAQGQVQGAETPVAFTVCTDPTRCPSEFNVPADKRLVIEYVSARLATPLAQASAIGFHTTTNGIGAIFYIPTE